MRYLFSLLVLVSWITIGCTGKKNVPKPPKEIKTAMDLIRYSSHLHDPKGNWDQFQSSVHFNTLLWTKDGTTKASSSSIGFDLPNRTFMTRDTSMGLQLDGLVTPDTCYVKADQELNTEQEEKLARRMGCESVEFYRDYYSFLIGLPMKLNDTQAIVNDTILERVYAGKSYDVVQVRYEPLDKQPIWYFYFDKEDHSYQLCKFTSREDENKGGEYIIYNQPVKIQGIQLYKQQVWLYNTPTLDTLAVDDLQFSSLKQ